MLKLALRASELTPEKAVQEKPLDANGTSHTSAAYGSAYAFGKLSNAPSVCA